MINSNNPMVRSNDYLAHSIGGGVGSVVHDAWMNPCDVVKQRLQMKDSPYVNKTYLSIIRILV